MERASLTPNAIPHHHVLQAAGANENARGEAGSLRLTACDARSAQVVKLAIGARAIDQYALAAVKQPSIIYYDKSVN